MGLGGPRQREDLFDLDAHLAGVDESGDAGQGRAVRFDQEGAGAQAPGRRRAGQVGGNAGDRDDQAVGAQDFQRSGTGVVVPVPDQVDDDVDVLDSLLEPDGGVVDQFVGAERGEPVVAAGAGGTDDVGAQVLGELDGEVPDAAGGRVDQ